jgi:hypothetical protein
LQRLIWLVFLGGLVVTRVWGGELGGIIYPLAVLFVIAVFRRPLVLGLTRLASRLGMMKETIQRMPDVIHLSQEREVPKRAQPIHSALSACSFVDAGVWSIAEMPKIQVSLMVNPGEGMLAAIESAAPIGAHVNLHTLYPDGFVASFSNSELPAPKELPPNVQRAQFPRCTPGALLLRARAQRPKGETRAISIEEAPRIYEQLYANDIQFRKAQLTRS